MSKKSVTRIYQGRVVRVELKNGSNWEEYKDWESLLYNHHRIFQDAVNYYLLCFVALAGNKYRPSDDKPCPVYQLRDQIKEKWNLFNYRGAFREGMQKSIEKYLFENNKLPSPENCLDKILKGNNSKKESLHKAITAMLKHCSGSSSIQKSGREFAPAFFWSEYKGQGAYKEGTAAKNREKEFQNFSKNLWDDNYPVDKLCMETDSRCVLRIGEGHYAGKVLKNKLIESIKEFKNDDVASAEEVRSLEKCIDEKMKDPSFQIPKYKGGGGDIGLRSKAFILFKYIKANNTTRNFLKKKINQPREKKTSKKNEIKYLDIEGKDPIEHCRGKRGYVFSAFTSLPYWGSSALGQSQWKEFDIAALKKP